MLDFVVRFRIVSGRDGELFSTAPVIPLRISAESAVAALEVFAQRCYGKILKTANGREPSVVDARVQVDGRVFQVQVCDWQ